MLIIFIKIFSFLILIPPHHAIGIITTYPVEAKYSKKRSRIGMTLYGVLGGGEG